jgi:hypothetical protein
MVATLKCRQADVNHAVTLEFGQKDWGFCPRFVKAGITGRKGYRLFDFLLQTRLI